MLKNRSYELKPDERANLGDDCAYVTMSNLSIHIHPGDPIFFILYVTFFLHHVKYT